MMLVRMSKVFLRRDRDNVALSQFFATFAGLRLARLRLKVREKEEKKKKK